MVPPLINLPRLLSIPIHPHHFNCAEPIVWMKKTHPVEYRLIRTIKLINPKDIQYPLGSYVSKDKLMVRILTYSLAKKSEP